MVYIIALLVIVIDQITKYVAVAFLYNPITIINGVFDFTLVYNQGAAFGILQNQKIVFLILTPIIIAFLFFYIKKHYKDNFWGNLSLGLIAGGAIGNYIDRIRLTYVIDFLDFKIWPVFNIADSCVVIGATILCLLLLKTPDKQGS